MNKKKKKKKSRIVIHKILFEANIPLYSSRFSPSILERGLQWQPSYQFCWALSQKKQHKALKAGKFGTQSTFLMNHELRLSFKQFWTFLSWWIGALSWIKMRSLLGNNSSTKGITSFCKCPRYNLDSTLDIFLQQKSK